MRDRYSYTCIYERERRKIKEKEKKKETTKWWEDKGGINQM